MLEEVKESEITLDNDMSATGFPPLLHNIALVPDFDNLVYGTVDHGDVIYLNPPTFNTVRDINNPPS